MISTLVDGIETQTYTYKYPHIQYSKIKIIENKLSNSKTPSAGQFNVIDNMESFISGAIVKNPPATQGCVCLTRLLRELSSIYVKIT